MPNILVIGDSHIPFEKKGYLDFCLDTKKKYKCSLIIHIGDLVDNHAINYHEHSPDGYSPFQEHDIALEHLKEWYTAFPKVYVCKGNHDELVSRKAITYGLSSVFFRKFSEIWELPKKWSYEWSHHFLGIKFVHGKGTTGKYAHTRAAENNRCNIVIGHNHSVAGIQWMASDHDLIFGMSTGCGIDRKKYAFHYGKEWVRKPILSCSVIAENGTHPIVVPMKI